MPSDTCQESGTGNTGESSGPMNEKPETDQHASIKSGGAHDHFSITTDYSSRDQLSPPMAPESNNRLREPVRSPRDLAGRKSRSPYATQKRRQSVSFCHHWIATNRFSDGKNRKRTIHIG